VFTPPDDLPEARLRAAVESGWSLRTAALEYRPVGFGSHHWALTDTSGAHWFVTVDDLRTRRFTLGESLTAGYDRLRAALTAAGALRAAGRDFVVAPLPARNGETAIRLGDPFAVAVYPLVAGESLDWDSFTPSNRLALLDLLVAVHTAPPEVRDRALPDDYAIQLRELITATVDPGTGPYAQPAADLLAEHGPAVSQALTGYDDLVAAARTDPPALVLTHGEPHPGNTMRTPDGTWLLIDWDTALVSPPERDLWSLDPGDGSLYAAYAAATGTTLRREVLDLYSLRWDLTEIALCLAHFRNQHGTSADDKETWANLKDSVTAIAAKP
jgi:aminoglycoside phosphotransferase (APT) family kinase protein